MKGAPADLLVVGGRVLVGAGGGEARSADVAIRDGVIIAVGDRLGHLRGPRTEILDIRGATICPGLVDGHSHPVMGIDLADGIDLSRSVTLEQVRAVLAQGAAQRPDHEWLMGFGLDPNVFGGESVTSAPFEAAVGARPTLLYLFDGHAAVASRSALARAGIEGARRLGAGASIVVDENGRPTGHLLEEAAVQLVAGLIPRASSAVRRRQLSDLLVWMASSGLTGAHVMDAKGDALDLFAALDEADALPLRLRVAPWCRPEDDVASLVGLQSAGGQMWQVAGIKFFLDGTIDGGTAWLSSPDSLGESSTPGWDPVEYAERLTFFDAVGVPTATHAIGDAACRHVLDTIASLRGAGGVRSGGGPRHRVEHVETLPDDLLPRFAALGVGVSMQPSHATDYTSADGSDNWSRRLGPRRAAQGWRCADVARSGGALILGSDWPVAPFDPRVTMAAGILRRPPADPDARPVQPAQALTIEEALRACTQAPAWVAGSRGGTVAVGLDADLTILAEDPRIVPADDLIQLPVQATISGGRVRFRTD